MRATRDGSQVAVQAVAYGSPKVRVSGFTRHVLTLFTTQERKAVIKSIKGLVAEIAKEEHGHLLLLSILDVTDDTVLVTKAVLNVRAVHSIQHLTLSKQELLKLPEQELLAIINHRTARLLLLHVLAPRDGKYFTPDTLRILTPVTVVDPATGEAQPTRYALQSEDYQPDQTTISKKDPETRKKQLLEGVLPPLLKFFASNAETLKATATSPTGSQVLFETIQNAEGMLPPSNSIDILTKQCQASQREPIYKLLAELVSGVAEDNIVNHFIASRDLKRLLKKGTNLFDQMAIACLTHTHPDPNLAPILLASLAGNLRHWAAKKGAAFVIAALLDSSDKDVASKVCYLKYLVMSEHTNTGNRWPLSCVHFWQSWKRSIPLEGRFL